MIKNIKGTVFIMVLAISMLMIIIAGSASNMVLQDVHMVKHLRYSTQAQYIAEAGISEVLAELLNRGSLSKSTYTGTLGATITVTTVSDIMLLTSKATVSEVSKTVAVEAKPNIPTSLFYVLSAGNNLRFMARRNSFQDFNGDLHANNNVTLKAKQNATIDIDPCGAACCTGDVSAGNTVSELGVGTISIAGDTITGAPMLTFPNFDYDFYKREAGTDDYHTGTTTFGSVGTDTYLQPANGIIYVDGTVRLLGRCHLYGGLVADRIRVIGQLNQIKTGTKNVIIAKGSATTVGDIEVFYKLTAAEAIIYAKRDFSVLSAPSGSTITITGALIASRNIHIWSFSPTVTYNHKVLTPDGLLGVGGENEPVDIISWNR